MHTVPHGGRSRVPSPRVLHNINPFVVAILRSPLHRLLSHRVLLLTFTGRTTGKVFTIPVEYTRDRETLTIFCTHPWWRNLRGSARVSLRLQGHRRSGRAEPSDASGAVLAAVDQRVITYGRKAAGRQLGIGLATIPPASRDELAVAMRDRVVIRLMLDPTPADARARSGEGELAMLQVQAPSTGPIRAAANAAVFVLKLLPMLPSRALDWLTPAPVVERVRYPTPSGQVAGDLYRPSTHGPHPGVVVCLGVVPFGVDHPQVARLGAALARSGFAALLYWSPAMRDLRFDPTDIESMAQAYGWLIAQPYIDPRHSGFIGTCVGGSFALMAAAQPAIRDRVAFVAAFAPFASMRTLAQDIASATRLRGAAREPWPVDPLTRTVLVRSLTALLEPGEAAVLRTVCAEPSGHTDRPLSADGRAVYRLLTALDVDTVEAALKRLPAAMQAQMDAMSPLRYLPEIHAPLIVFGHDRDDLVIPVGESRRLRAALSGRAGVQYTEFALFQHMDPTKRKLPPLRMAQELGKFYRYVYPLFRQAVAPYGKGM